MEQDTPTRVTITAIIDEVCDYYGVTPAEIRSKSRLQPLTRYRMIVCYLSRKMTDKSFPYIARTVGRSDHSTVIHACRTIDSLLGRDAVLKGDVELIERIVRGEAGKKETLPEVLARLAVLERQRAWRVRERRLVRARKYLETRRKRELAKRLAVMTETEIMEWKIRHYTAQPLRVRMEDTGRSYARWAA